MPYNYKSNWARGLGVMRMETRMNRTGSPARARIGPLLLGAALALAPGTVATASHAEPCEYEVGLVQVVLELGVPIGVINGLYGTLAADSLPPLYLLTIPEGADEQSFASLLEEDPNVAGAEPAFRSETPEGTRQMMVAGVGGTIEDYQDQEFVDRIGMIPTHEHTRGDGVVIALLDTGLLASHPALENAVAAGGYDFVGNDGDPSDTANGVDDDGDGLTDEGAGHGTMVAGIAHLIAPGAALLPLRVLDDEGRGRTFDVAKAIHYATDAGARIVHMSLGLTCVSKIIAHEVRRADSLGVSVVAAAGNDGREEPPYYPASDSLALSVAAVDSADVKASFSNYHTTVDLSAPGVGILSPFHDGEYALGAGTSFAAPFVSGQVALIRSLNPSLSKAQVDSLARLGVAPIDSIPGNEPFQGKLGTGRVDLWATWLATPAAAGVPIAIPGEGRQAIAAYPNPQASGARVTIRFAESALVAGTMTVVGIFDPSGRLLRKIDESMQPTDAELTWDGRDQAGRPLPSGIYFVKPLGAGTGARLVVIPR